MFASTGARLLGVTLLAASPVLLVMAVTFVSERRAVREYAGEQVLLVAHLTAAQQQALVAQTQRMTAGLAGSPDARSDPATCARELTDQLSRNPALASLGIADREGNVWCSGRALTGAVSIADRSYFRDVLRTGEPAVGTYQISRTSGLPSLNVAVPVRVGANVVGVAFAGIDLRMLTRLVEDADPPPGHTMTLVDRQDTILIRYPDPDTWAGRPAPATDIVRQALATRAEAVAEFDGVDGVRRLYGIVRLEQGGESFAYVTVGIPSEEIYGELNRALTRGVVASLVGVAMAVAVVLVGGHFIVTRPTNRLLAAATRIGAGEFEVDASRRYRGDEFGELERAVDTMAATLQARDVALAEQHRLQAEFDQVAELQASVLPGSSHAAPAFDLAARCMPARRVGGDFYDWWEDDRGILHIVLGDVMGKGIRAAPLMAGARAALRVAGRFGPPGAALGSLEPAILRDFEQTGSFITLFYAQMDPATGELRYTDAGHGLGFVVHASGEVEQLPPHSMPLGVLGGMGFTDSSVRLRAGDTLLVASDGLLDEYPALLNDPAVALGSVAGIASAAGVVDTVVSPQSLLVGDDDLTVIAVRWFGPAPDQPARSAAQEEA